MKDVKSEDETIKYQKVHVSFQSTSSCNIQCVNSLNENMLFTSKKSRGSGAQKRSWVIEMNSARQLYLNTYGQVDTIDWLIKKCHLFFISWKYWHSAKLHVDALVLVIPYNMYKEIATEKTSLDFLG